MRPVSSRSVDVDPACPPRARGRLDEARGHGPTGNGRICRRSRSTTTPTPAPPWSRRMGTSSISNIGSDRDPGMGTQRQGSPHIRRAATIPPVEGRRSCIDDLGAGGVWSGSLSTQPELRFPAISWSWCLASSSGVVGENQGSAPPAWPGTGIENGFHQVVVFMPITGIVDRVDNPRYGIDPDLDPPDGR